ncbi:uncharacterized protein LOC123873547 isoform X3 [Maniola jurtina]|uniref:uncharacterized protein LOC123873547 isoform X3 n=1 Tax=Maniola jurtina TaxID=191418 RepID=UPI001E68B04E|nr:uncharacterized protein LOC123873547 isoform X3 [Maniola jurtina]
MDKNEYETYEYLPTSYVNETDTSQLLVVQEDGTFLCFDRPIQYVTQVEDGKDVLEGVQGCNVYNVVPQQLYIDGDNSSELISAVQDQFTLPDEDNNSYANNYLLQDDENSKEVPMEQDEVVQYKEVTTNNEEVDINDTDIESAADNNSGDCTEITLNDEQYQILEQKGWILLESSDKTFLLDSSGLHDITADEKLILKLKCELQENMEEEGASCSIKVDKVQNKTTEIKLENMQPETENIVEEDMAGYIIEEEGIIEQEEPEEMNFTTNQQGTVKINTEQTIEEECADAADIITPIEAEHDYVKLNSVKDSYVKRQSDTIKVKTKFLFKNVPPEIVLGKFNGKKLIARVVKTDRPVRKLGTNNIHDAQMATTEQPGLDDDKFEVLIREAVRGTTECGVKDVTAAEIVVGQLSRVPAFRPAVMERGLIITKVIIQEHETGDLYSESNPSLVTGRAIREKDNFNNCRFRFIPEMLRKLAYIQEYENDEDYDGESNLYDFLHIHIRETKSIDGIIRISITLNKRHIPLNLFTDNNAKLPNTIYACSSCASVYKTEEGLRLHQETECVTTETENTLTIDPDEAKNAYTIINLGKDTKQYGCNVCNIVYTKLDNCQEHIKTHFKEESDSERTSKQIVRSEIKKTLSLYRCKMCNRAFLDACALSKHIVTKHIQHLDVKQSLD